MEVEKIHVRLLFSLYIINHCGIDVVRNVGTTFPKNVCFPYISRCYFAGDLYPEHYFRCAHVPSIGSGYNYELQWYVSKNPGNRSDMLPLKTSLSYLQCKISDPFLQTFKPSLIIEGNAI